MLDCRIRPVFAGLLIALSALGNALVHAESKIITAPKNPVPERLASPLEMDLKGTERRVSIPSDLGPMELRWQRDVEVFFGRTPERALIEAARSVNRALNQGGFPVSLTALKVQWNVIFFGDNLPDGQVPQALISNCHPGWMTGTEREVNIFIRAQAVAMGCSGSPSVGRNVADEQLSQVVVHEIGHGIERVLLKGHNLGERMRAEGFATWFEQYVAEYSPLLRSKDISRYYKDLARQRLLRSSGSVFSFGGTIYDYAYASMYFVALQERFGTRGMFTIYDIISSRPASLFEAVLDRFNWRRDRLESEVSRLLK